MAITGLQTGEIVRNLTGMETGKTGRGGKGQMDALLGKRQNADKTGREREVYGDAARFEPSRERTRVQRPTDPENLSETAKNYLAQLREKYANMDIMVADYETDEEAQRILAAGTKNTNVVIDTETLEKMATDETERTKYESILDQSKAVFEQVKEALTEEADGDEHAADFVKSIGISVDGNGNVSYFSIIDESLKRRYEAKTDDKDRTGRKEETERRVSDEEKARAAYQKPKEPRFRMLKEDSVDALIARLKETLTARTEQRQAQQESGAAIDFRL